MYFESSGGSGICSNYMIFRIMGSFAISVKFRKKTLKKGEIFKIVENQKCLSVIQIYLTINLHI